MMMMKHAEHELPLEIRDVGLRELPMTMRAAESLFQGWYIAHAASFHG
jgi:hypothetical protein